MKAVISSTYDDNYLFYLPITTWLWNKLGINVICFIPNTNNKKDEEKIQLCSKYLPSLKFNFLFFDAPEHKKATYAQCSRLYASCEKSNVTYGDIGKIINLSEDEVLITSDIDMALFNIPDYDTGYNTKFTIFGSDLVPPQQYPMCYISGKVKDWRNAFKLHGITYQQALDKLLMEIECENMRGNYWGKDQEEAYKNIVESDIICTIDRAKPNTQFASNRIDRDDAFFMDRLSPDIIDYHMHRPGYTDENFEKILSVIQYFYQNEDLQWMSGYHKEYKLLL